MARFSVARDPMRASGQWQPHYELKSHRLLSVVMLPPKLLPPSRQQATRSCHLFRIINRLYCFVLNLFGYFDQCRVIRQCRKHLHRSDQADLGFPLFSKYGYSAR